MSETLPAQTLLLEAAEQKQRLAADPTVSAWVRANAGTGKTHVLVQRLLRLLLSGAEPRSILCLTFTKNAAAEMEARVLASLGEWATANSGTLKTRLAGLLARAPSSAELALAPCLFATVIDAPGGLAIMTIHGFCERVLRRYSLEASVPPGFAVLTEEEAAGALKEATASTFAAAASGPWHDALTAIAAHASEGEFSRVLSAMLCNRTALAHLFRVSAAGDPLPPIAARLYRLFGLASGDTRAGLIERSASVLDQRTLQEIVSALSAGTKTDIECTERFEAVLHTAHGEQKCAALKAAFSTKGGEPRKSLMTASVKKRAPALHNALVEAQAVFLAFDEKLGGLKAIEATMALLRLTSAIFERYEDEKRTRAALDFDDLIGKTLSLLSRQDAADWVLYELDARIDHILLDEAQDTSPEQWAILERLTSDFFAGQGARDCLPTLFAVGDEKQSIYGFQGAVPELLAHYGALYEERVREAGFDWRGVNLDLSFRTLDPVLAAVDDISRSLPGLRKSGPVPHLAFRRDGVGLVELWEPERGGKEEKGDGWEPDTEDAPSPRAAKTLAERIAAQIGHWLDNGERLASRGRPIEPGDILILLRKREPMAKLLQAALMRKGIAVAGADRMALLEDLAVMDLLALADAVLQPEDDLALAAVLKGPLFGFCDDGLFALAFGRQTSLWRSLERAAEEGDTKQAAAAAKLNSWRDAAHECSAFDFFARVLDEEGGRKAFAARLGAECFDAIDELLNLAETFGMKGAAGLAEFVRFARQSASEVKRETDRAAREVRIMTVHGAKGLEADIVILADSCNNRNGASAPIFLLGDDTGAPPIPVWAIKGAMGLPPFARAKDASNEAARREQERLLYVAITRARDRLYIAGSHNNFLPEGCWHETIQRALAPRLQEGKDFRGRTVWRTASREEVSFSVPATPAKKLGSPETPSCFDAPAPKEDALSILSPSRLIHWSNERTTAIERPIDTDRRTAQARGTLIHRLLEVLPALSGNSRARVARTIASAFSGVLSEKQRAEAIETSMQIASGDIMMQGWDHGPMPAALNPNSRPPHPGLLPKGRKDAVSPAPPPHPLADAAALSGKLPNASLRERADLSSPSLLGERVGVRGDRRSGFRAVAMSEAGLVAWLAGPDGKEHAVILGQADRVLLAGRDITVLDYKSGTLAGDDGIAKAYLAQLSCYRLALQRIYPTANVRAALLDTRLGTAVEAADDMLEAALSEISSSLSRRAKSPDV